MILVFLFAFFLCGCGSGAPETSAREEELKRAVEIVKTMGLDAEELEPMPKDAYTEPDRDCTEIILSDSGSRAKRGVRIFGNEVRIIASGTYRISGSLTDGRIIVDLPKSEDARLILDGISLHCDGAAPLLIEQADKVVLSLAPGSVNRISGDGLGKGEDGRAEDAVIMSSEDLVVNGSGSLELNCTEGCGIHTRDSLKIMEGSLTVRSGRTGLIGRDAVVIEDGILRITAGEDGISSTNSDAPGRGFVFIGGGTHEITAVRYDIRAFDAFVFTYGDLGLSGGEEGIDCARKVILSAGLYEMRTEIADNGAPEKEEKPSGNREQTETEGQAEELEPADRSEVPESSETALSGDQASSVPESTAETLREESREAEDKPSEPSDSNLINGYPKDSFTGFSGGLRERRGKQ